MLPTQEALKTTYNQAVLNDIIALNKLYYIIHNTAFASRCYFCTQKQVAPVQLNRLEVLI